MREMSAFQEIKDFSSFVKDYGAYRSNPCIKVLALQARAGYSALEVNLGCSRVMSE